MDGILGMTLTAYKPGRERTLFYHAMSSPSENWVETTYIRNKTIFEGNAYAAPQIFHVSIMSVHIRFKTVYCMIGFKV